MASATTNMATQQESFTHFFDLPQEVRDMIYIYWPKIAWIDVAQTFPYNHSPTDREHDKSVLQPNISRVSRRMRHECLDVFYGRNKFLLDLRGWKHQDYPKRWTPLQIFEHWLAAIGDANAARVRSLSFWSHNFSAHVRVAFEEECPRLAMKFRPTGSKPELAENVPGEYSYGVACRRAELGLRGVLDGIEARRKGRSLDAGDLIRICRAVERIQPFLCKRCNLGYQNAILHSGDMSKWPDTAAHLNKCDDCGYHRFTRGED